MDESDKGDIQKVGVPLQTGLENTIKSTVDTYGRWVVMTMFSVGFLIQQSWLTVY